MNLKSIIIGAVLLGASVMAAAQALPGQTLQFQYTPWQLVNTDFSGAGNLTLQSKTDINVDAYLYISGNLSANWLVTGWGTGSDQEVNSIYFYHNETLTFQFANFDNPKKIEGTPTGSEEVKLDGEVQCYNQATNSLLWDSGMMPIKNLNGMFSTSGPSFTTNTTGGLMRMDFSKQINITPKVGPGTYQNVGTITVVRL